MLHSQTVAIQIDFDDIMILDIEHLNGTLSCKCGDDLMRLEQLNYLIAVDQYHSMNKASQKIFVAQQSISTALAELEKEFGTQLVYRTNKGSFLTEAGKDLVKATQDFYAQCDKIKKSSNSSKKPLHIHLLIEYPILSVYDKIFLYFAEQFPNISLSRSDISYAELEQGLAENPTGVAVICLTDDDIQSFSAKYYLSYIKSDRLLLYVSKNSPLAKNKTVSLSKIKNARILFYTSPDKPSVLLHALLKHNLDSKNNIFLYNTTITLQSGLSKYSNVICFAPETTEPAYPDSEYVPISLKETLLLHWCCVSKSQIPAELTSALQTLL